MTSGLQAINMKLGLDIGDVVSWKKKKGDNSPKVYRHALKTI
jgi:hypothetical protein